MILFGGLLSSFVLLTLMVIGNGVVMVGLDLASTDHFKNFVFAHPELYLLNFPTSNNVAFRELQRMRRAKITLGSLASPVLYTSVLLVPLDIKLFWTFPTPSLPTMLCPAGKSDAKLSFLLLSYRTGFDTIYGRY